MIRIVLKQKGHTIDLNGKSFTTPATISFNKIDLNKVMMKLKSMGISKYDIFVDDSPKPKLKIPSQEELSNDKKIDIAVIDVQSQEEMIEKLSGLEKKLDLLSKDIKNVSIVKNEPNFDFLENKPKEKEEEGEESFIPSFDTTNLEVKSNTSNIKKIDSANEDILNYANYLSEIQGDKK